MSAGNADPASGPGFPGLGGAVLLSIAAVAAMLAAALVVDALGIATSGALTAGLVNIASLGTVTFVAWRRTGATAEDAFPLRPLAGEPLGWMLVTLVGAGIVLSELDNYVRALLGPPPEAFQLDVLLEGALPGLIFTLVIVAPVTEELLFRGIILRGLAMRHGAVFAITVSAALFAAVHVNPWQMPGAFGIGLVLGWWYLSTRNLSVTIAGHGVTNLIWLLAVLLLPPIRGLTAIPADEPVHQPFPLTLTGVMLLVLGTAQCRARFRARHARA